MRLFVILLALQVGCYAPRAGAERPTYIGLATFDAGIVGAVGGSIGCLFATRGAISPTRIPQIPNARRKRALCAIAGAVPAAAGSFYGSVEAERQPDQSAWIAISTMAVAGSLWLLVRTLSETE